MYSPLVSPTSRGQVTIPKQIRDALRITPKTKFRVYATTDKKVVLEPVSPLEDLMDILEMEAKEKGYSREDIEREVEVVREQLVKKMYGE